jgi:WD40 repeat protein
MHQSRSDGKRIGSGSRDLAAKIWDTETGKELFTLRGHSGPVIGVAFSRDGKLIATASQDGTTKVWDGATGAEMRNVVLA